jgi:hypothetical protein
MKSIHVRLRNKGRLLGKSKYWLGHKQMYSKRNNQERSSRETFLRRE